MGAKGTKQDATKKVRGREQSRWLFLVQGVLAVIVGLGLLIIPGQTLFVIVLLLGAYWFVRGIATLLYATIEHTQRAWKVFAGAFGVLAGLLAMTAPLYVASAFFAFAVIFIGVQALMTGAVEFYQGILGRSWALTMLGFISVMLGAVLLLNPWVSGALLRVTLGLFALLGGLLTIVVTLRGESEVREAVRVR